MFDPFPLLPSSICQGSFIHRHYLQANVVWYGDTSTKLVDVFKDHHKIETWKTIKGELNYTLMGIPGVVD